MASRPVAPFTFEDVLTGTRPPVFEDVPAAPMTFQDWSPTQQAVASRYLSPDALATLQAGQEPVSRYLTTPVTYQEPQAIIGGGGGPRTVPRWQYALERGLPEVVGALVAGGPQNLPSAVGAEALGTAQAEILRRLGARFAPVAEATAARTAVAGPAPALSRAAEPPPLLSMEGQPITRAQPLTAAQEAATQTTQAVTPQEVIAAQRPGETFAQTHQRLITERIVTTSPVITEGTPVDRVVAALKSAGPVRAEQEALYSAERGRRIAASQAAGAQVTGQAGYAARLGPLRGQLPKVQFQPLALAQADKDALYDMVANSPNLDPEFGVIRAMTGLDKLLEGSVVPQENELTLLGRVFGKDFVQAVQGAGLPPWRRTAFEVAGKIAGTFRSLMSSLDYSFPGRQGIFAAPRYAKQWGGNFKPMFQASFRQEAEDATAQEITQRPNFTAGYYDRAGLALPVVDKSGVSAEELRALADYAERIPGLGQLVRASNRAYATYGSKLRADIFDAILAGRIAKPATALTDVELEAIGGFVNTITGRGAVKNIPIIGQYIQSVSGLTKTIYAPSLIASRVSLLNPFYYINLDPIIRKEALKTAGLFYGSMATVLSAAVAAGAAYGVKVGTNRLSADFGKILVPTHVMSFAATLPYIAPGVFGVGVQTYGGYTRYDLTGGYGGYIRLLSQFVAGKAISSVTGLPKTVRGRPYTRYEIVKDFVENKYSPVASAIKEFLSQEERPKTHPYNVIEEVVSRMTSMVLQDDYDLTNGGTETFGQAIDRWIRGTHRP